MALNYLWVGFFLVAFVAAMVQWLMLGDSEIFSRLVNSTFDNAKLAFEISIYLTGVMALWLGLMRIGEKSGLIKAFAWLVGPFFARLFPSIPRDHPAMGAMIMNFSANMLGLDNAATPLGLKTMDEMQKLNPTPDTASDAQIMFLVLNTSGLSIIPLTVIVDRSVMGATYPTDIFLPVLIATFFSTVVGLITVGLYQRLKLLNPVVLGYLGGFTLLIVGLIYYFSNLPPEKVSAVSGLISNFIIFSIIIGFVAFGLIRKVNVYETFIEGAKDGFTIAVKIIPYLVAMLVAIGLLRESGVIDVLVEGVKRICVFAGLDTAFVDALPTAFLKPLSGNSARGMNLEIMEHFGPDSFAGKLSSVFRGATETTLYIVALYFGAVNIKKTRYAIPAGLIADLAGIIAAIFIAYLFFQQ